MDLLRYEQALAADFPGIAVPYHEDKLSRMCGTEGRLTPGADSEARVKDQAYSNEIKHLIASGMNIWQATRALHSGPKFYKEIARGLTVMDADRPKSFPNTIHDRYPDLVHVEMWCKDPAHFAAEAGFDISDPDQYKICKEFVNSAAGSGKTFEDTWLHNAGLSTLPGILQKYRNELRVAAERDCVARPDLVEAIKKPAMTISQIQNKVHYVVNSEMERRDSEEALERRAALCRTVAFESDGFPCPVKDAAEAQAILAAMNAGLPAHKHMIHKKYRGREELLEELKKRFPEIPASEFEEVDPTWERKAMARLHFKKYLHAGVQPLKLAQELIPDYIYLGRRVNETFCTVVGTKDALDYRQFIVKKHGGHWITIHRKLGDSWLSGVCAAFCNEVEGRTEGNERPTVQNLILPEKMMSKVNPILYNRRILQEMNMEQTWPLLQFDCGRIMDTRTMEVRDGVAKDFISFSTGYDYPMDLKIALGLCKDQPGKLQDKAIDLKGLFADIRDFEAGLGDLVPLEKYPDAIETKLHTLANMEEFALLKVAYSFFESWPVAVYRCLKIVCCGLFSVRTKAFVHDRGDSGDNGKTVWQIITECIGGQYYHEIDSTMATRPPPPSSAPTPDLYMMVGKRLFGTPEMPRRKPVNGDWLKKVADPASNWTTREPHACTPLSFKLNAMLACSTNAKLEFDFKDGGCDNRGIGVLWEFKFCKKAKPNTNEREASTIDIKDKRTIMPMVPGFYILLEMVYEVFYKGIHHEKPAVKVPRAVHEATNELISEETTNTICEILDCDFKRVDAKGMSFVKIKQYLDQHPFIEALLGQRPAQKTVEKFMMVLQKVLKQTAAHGARSTLYDGSQITLKPEPERTSRNASRDD